MPKPKLQIDADGYRIVGSDEGEGDVVDFGVQATYDSEDGKEHLAALVDLDANDEPITCLPGGAWITDTVKGTSVTGTSMTDVELEEVEFDEGEAVAVLDDEEEEGDGDDDDDDLVADEGDEEEGDDDDEEEIEELKS